MSEEEISRHVKSHAVKQVTHIHSLARGRQLGNKVVRPRLKDVHVADLILDEHGSDQRTTVVPLLAIGGEDAVA